MAGLELDDDAIDAAPVVRTSPSISFELYPSRTSAASIGLGASLAHLVAAEPEFISVTYGANGSSRDASIDVLRYLKNSTSVQPMAHLTCVGSSYADASAVIRQFLDEGITSFLALRGDPPKGVSEDDVFLGDLGSAGELVQLIHRVQTERVPFEQVAVPGFPGARRIAHRERLTVAVAAFPNGHPRSRSVQQDLDTLLAKEAAGANLAITQLFFDAADYARFVVEARDAGVTMRILPGIMPVLSVARLRRIIELTGERLPAELLARLEASDDPASVGIDHAAALSRDLLDVGADGIHLYTFNQHEAPLAVLRAAGLLTHPTALKEFV